MYHTRSKWPRLLRYALAYKCHSEPLDQFIKRKGGINSCASRFTRCLEGAAARASGLSPRAALSNAVMHNVRWRPFMPKHSPGTEREIIMSVDRDAGVLDLRIFANQHKRAEV